MADSELLLLRDLARRYATFAQQGLLLNPTYVSLEVGVFPDDYAEGTGAPTGAMVTSDGLIIPLVWNFDQEIWESSMPDIATKDYVDAGGGGGGGSVSWQNIQGNPQDSISLTNYITQLISGDVTPPQPAVPGQVSLSNNNFVIGDEEFTIGWDLPEITNGEILSYRIVVRSILTGFETTRTVSGAVNVQTFTGLANGIEYTVSLRARNAIGFGPENFFVVKPVSAGTPPEIAELDISPRDGSILLEFNIFQGSSSVTEYAYSIDSSTFVPFTPVEGPDGQFFLITGLTNGQFYPTRLRVTNASGSVTSSELNVAPQAISPSSTPSDLQVIPVANGIIVHSLITDLGSGRFVGYDVEYIANGVTNLKEFSGAASPAGGRYYYFFGSSKSAMAGILSSGANPTSAHPSTTYSIRLKSITKDEGAFIKSGWSQLITGSPNTSGTSAPIILGFVNTGAFLFAGKIQLQYAVYDGGLPVTTEIKIDGNPFEPTAPYESSNPWDMIIDGLPSGDHDFQMRFTNSQGTVTTNILTVTVP